MAFPFDVNVNYNPGNAITGLNQFNNLLATTAGALAKLASAGNIPMQGIDNFIASAARGATASNTLGSAALKITNSLAGINSGAQQAGAGLTDLGGKANAASSSIQNVSGVTKNLGPAFQVVAGAVLQTGGSFNTMGTQAQAAVAKLVGMGGALRNLEGIVATTSAQMKILSPVVAQTSQSFSAGLAPSIAAGVAPLSNLNAQLGTTATGLNNVGGAATTSATGFGRLREMFTGNRGLVFGMSAFFGTLTGIAFELQLVGDANKQVAQSQGVVNGLIAAGKEGTGQYSQAVQALGKDQRFLEFSSRNLALAFTNLIPDVLLITNGIIQLTDKFAKTGAAAATATAGLTTVTSGMTAAATSSTVLNTAQATLGTGFVNSSNAMKTMIPVLAGTRAEQAGLVLTSNGLAVSQEAVAAKTVLSRDAIRGLQGVIALTRAEEIGLIATNDALGASFLNVGKGAAAGGGGIKGFLGNLLGLGAGGGLKGILGAIGGVALPVAGAIGFVAFADQFAKSATAVVNSRLLAEKALEDANKKQGEDIVRLSDTVSTGATQIAGHWSTLASNVTASADKIIAKQNEIAGTGGTGGSGQGDWWTQQGKQDFSGGTSTAAGNVLDIAGGKKGGPLSQLGSNFSDQQTPPQLRDWQRRQSAAAVARNPAAGMNGVIVDQFTSPFGFYGQPAAGLGTQPMTQEGEFQRFIDETNKTGMISSSDTTKKILPDFAGKKVLGGMDLNQLTEMLKAEDDISKKEADIEAKRTAKTVSPADIAELQLLKEKSQELLVNKDALDKTKASQDLVTKQIETATTAMHKHNEAVLKMPTALAAATGAELEMSRVVQTAMGPAVARDLELDNHIALMAQQSAAYTNINAVQGQSLKVQEEIVNIGNKVVGGVEEELTHVQALNIFWGNLSTTMKDNILTNQQLTIASVDVTASLTNQAQHQFLVNEGMIAGKEAAQQFIEQTVAGVAQTEQFRASLQEIADTMGVKFPAGLRATSEELQAGILEMEQFGSTATTSAQMLNDRFGAAFKMVGGLIDKAIEGSKEFNKAWKDLDLSAVPKSQRGFFKDMVKDMADVKEKADAMTTSVGLTMTAISTGAMKGKQASSFIKEFGTELGKLGDMDPRLAPITDRLQGFLDAIPDGQRLAGLRQYGEMWETIVVPALEDGVITNQEIASIMEQLDARLKPLPERLNDLSKAAGGIAPQFDAAGTGVDTFISKMEKLDQMASSKNKNVARLGEILQGSVGGFTGGTVIKHGEVLAETEEDKARRLEHEKRDKEKEGKGPDVSKVAEQLSGIVGTITKMVPQIQGLVNGMAKNVVAVLGFMAINANKVIGDMATNVFTNIGTMVKNSITVISAFTKGVQTLFIAMALNSNKVVGDMAVNVFTNIGTMITNSISVLSAFVKGVQVLFAGMADNSLEIVVAFQTNITEAITQMTTNVTAVIQNMVDVSIDNITNMSETSTEVIADMAATILETSTQMATDVSAVILNMKDIVVKAIEDMRDDGSAAVKTFASTMDSELSKVAKAAGSAWQAVTDLADAVEELDGASAKVTITTEFKTTGSAVSAGAKAAANNLLGAVISAASPKSFQYGGSIETSHGPQMAIYGDNPGGTETVAFIPHDNPFPTLKKLAKLFKGGGSTSELIERGIGQAEEIVINATFVIENVLDSQKVGTQIVKRTFRKMRTR
jgi:hypothetical protein